MITTHKTKFGMYAPYDYITYKKLKKIKSAINVSYFKVQRHNRWVLKLEKNRSYPAPIPCSLFYDKIIETKKNYYDNITYNKEVYVYSKMDNITYEEYFMKLWEIAKTLSLNPEVEYIPIDKELLEKFYQGSKDYIDNLPKKIRKKKVLP